MSVDTIGKYYDLFQNSEIGQGGQTGEERSISQFTKQCALPAILFDKCSSLEQEISAWMIFE